jgi:hypothetical protein
MFGSQTKQLITQLPTLVYLAEDSTKYSLFKNLTNRVYKTYGPIGRG